LDSQPHLEYTADEYHNRLCSSEAVSAFGKRSTVHATLYPPMTIVSARDRVCPSTVHPVKSMSTASCDMSTKRKHLISMLLSSFVSALFSLTAQCLLHTALTTNKAPAVVLAPCLRRSALNAARMSRIKPSRNCQSINISLHKRRLVSILPATAAIRQTC
jgi:hypothetical protein